MVFIRPWVNQNESLTHKFFKVGSQVACLVWASTELEEHMPNRINMDSAARIKGATAIAIYDEYSDAQRAVDYLSDREFPVEYCTIVGTDLRSVEKVTGRLTWGKVMGAGALQGVIWGIGLGLLMMLFWPGAGLATLVMAVAIFILINLITTAITYQVSGGNRDFTSTTAIVATHYEILVDRQHAAKARSILAGPTYTGTPNQVAQQDAAASQDLSSWAPPAAPSPQPDASQTPQQTFDPRGN